MEFINDTPAAIVNLEVLETNIQDMAAFCKGKNINLRPHIKSHKMPEIALKQLKAGAIGITVAKLGEAEVMSEAGIKDIFIANQVTGPAKLKRLGVLARSTKISVGIDSLINAEELNELAKKEGFVLDVLIEINSGLNRCGLEPGEQVLNLAAELAKYPHLHFKGIFTHAGHAYGSSTKDEVEQIGSHEGLVMVQLATQLRQAGIPVEVVSVGSTPTAKYAALEGITELRPGNYVFYDAIQVALGVADVENCALRIRSTVISRPAADRAVIDAGSKTLNLDKGAHGTSLVKGFGLIPKRPGITIERLSEEHGVLSLQPGENLKVGDVIEIIPNHACTVVNLFDQVVGMRGEAFVKLLEVKARGRVK